jgi:lipid-A-disaccharide synthase
MRILISAAETSSDIHGAELLKAIQEQVGALEQVEAFGVGGPHLQKAGLRTIVDARELLAMGFIEILGKLPRVFKSFKELTQAASATRPDVAIFIDYPDFHFRLARRLKKMGIPMIYYIPPKVWAWRQHRVKFLKKFFTRILCILPFEEDFYKRFNIPVKYVGNPLVDELPLELSKADARVQLGIDKEEQVLVLMPGSRSSEIKGHFHLMIQAAEKVAKSLSEKGVLPRERKLQVLIPLPSTTDMSPLQSEASNSDRINLRIMQGNSAYCMAAADVGLIKSGTSTLEAGLMKCPHAVVYKPTRTTAWIFKNLIRYKGPVGLVNLVAGWSPDQPYLAKEILCEQVTPESLSQEVVELMTNSSRRNQQVQGFEGLRKKVCGERNQLRPSLLAAQEVIQVVKELRSTSSLKRPLGESQ